MTAITSFTRTSTISLTAYAPTSAAMGIEHPTVTQRATSWFSAGPKVQLSRFITRPAEVP